ncbi:MAG: Bor family protein [Kistimonas sp.]|nr:Bor family protein [Kistimonas sp.]
MKKLVSLTFLVAILSGCASQSLTLRPRASGDFPDQEVSQDFFISGLLQKKHLDAAAVCGTADKVARVETVETPTNVVLSMLTFGLYTPRTVRVYCAR